MSSSDSHPSAESGFCWADLGRHEQLLVTGADAVTFIENFTTAKVSDLLPGAGCEGFFCDARGWVIDLVLIRRTNDGLVLRMGPGRAASLRSHLDRYQIREDLELLDQSEGLRSLLISGAVASRWLENHFDQSLPATPANFAEGLLTAAVGATPVPVRLTLIDWYGQGGFLVETTAGEQLVAALTAAGLPQVETGTVLAWRLHRGWPLAEDIPEKTLPQELGLDDRAICFNKGCYLGQETVARLDALGHVNRRLMLLAVAGDEPVALGAAVVSGDNQIAAVTSATAATEGAGWLALAILPLRRAAGQSLTVAGRPAEVLRFSSGEKSFE
jgi:folate-binding protein YgfZ